LLIWSDVVRVSEELYQIDQADRLICRTFGLRLLPESDVTDAVNQSQRSVGGVSGALRINEAQVHYVMSRNGWKVGREWKWKWKWNESGSGMKVESGWRIELQQPQS
jgi:hypothetical protein